MRPLLAHYGKFVECRLFKVWQIFGPVPLCFCMKNPLHTWQLLQIFFCARWCLHVTAEILLVSFYKWSVLSVAEIPPGELPGQSGQERGAEESEEHLWESTAKASGEGEGAGCRPGREPDPETAGNPGHTSLAETKGEIRFVQIKTFRNSQERKSNSQMYQIIRLLDEHTCSMQQTCMKRITCTLQTNGNNE